MKRRFLCSRRAGTFSLPGSFPGALKAQSHKVYNSVRHDVCELYKVNNHNLLKLFMLANN